MAFRQGKTDCRMPAAVQKFALRFTACLTTFHLCYQYESSAVFAQHPGFLSLSCGARSNFTDDNGIFWTPDSEFIQTGSVAYLNNLLLAPSLQNLRYFPPSRNKDCYVLPVESATTYLVRASFYYGNYDGLDSPLPAYFALIFNGNTWATVNITNAFLDIIYELIFFSETNSSSLSVCTARTSPSFDPFMSSLELRPLAPPMYNKVREDNLALRTWIRVDIGSKENIIVRYPDDPYDRIWLSDYSLNTSYLTLSTTTPVTTNDVRDMPCSFAMQTAKTTKDAFTQMNYQFYLPQDNQFYYIALYFAEIEALGPNDTRIFDITYFNNLLPNNLFYRSLNVAGLALGSFTSVEIYENQTSLYGALNFSFVATELSTKGPILNAAEILIVLTNLSSGTFYEDVQTLSYIQTRFNLQDWTGDPCLPANYSWNWVECDSEAEPRITGLKLSDTHLNGSIPESISEFKALTALLLDGNNLTGEIPDLSTLTKLQTLQLQNNALTGTIPSWLAGLPSLTQLFLENNNLSGVVPKNLTMKMGLTIRLSGNPYLCFEINSCKSSPLPSPMVSPPFSQNKQHSKSNQGLIAGIVVGTIFVLIIVVVLIWRYCSVRFPRKAGFKGVIDSPAQEAAFKPSRDLDQDHMFGYEEIQGFTKGFQRKIGEGGFGPVFYGKLPDGQEVAVKKLSANSRQGTTEFFNEVELLSRVHHRCLVTLLGYCNEPGQQILVYEYMPNGTLRDNLYGTTSESRKKLSWKMRLNIALNAAQGLEYLHTGCHPMIIHRDVKTSNILLNKNFSAKVADFGLSKLASDDGATHISASVKGTPGYLDPDYYNSHQLDEKSDVYSFGVVLLEIICGREPVKTNVPREEMSLVEWVRRHLQQGDIAGVVDESLGETYKMESMWKVAEIAITSAEPKGMYRPTMAEVVQELKSAIQIENGTSLSFSEINSAASGPVYPGQTHFFPGNFQSMDRGNFHTSHNNSAAAFSTELEGR